ncbi:MAG TPA: citrate lyase subunit alpha [Victivallales bacterium]|nr:citrate lyase subunit alpha [Victivallales bacterium]
MSCKLIKNAAGRLVPEEINGKSVIPFKGLGKHRPTGKKYGPSVASSLDYPQDGNKCVASLEEALIKCGLKDGMTISTHHHLRNGDLVSNKIFDISHELGIKDLVWFPSASFPCNEPIIEHLQNGTVNRIEGSMNGALGKFVTDGKMKGTAVLRSHGGRCQAIQDGEVKIDIAVIAAPSSDQFGNANGLLGPSACGGLGYVLIDYQYAEKVIIVTDNLIDFPCMPMQIEGNYVDYVVKEDKIGIPEKIVSGTTKITKSPDRLLIAEMTAKFCKQTEILHDGCYIQAGAGGTSLAIGVFLQKFLKEKNWKAKLGFGGSTQYMVKMLEEGQMEHILDAQAFDLEAVRSVKENLNHHAISVFHAYNFHSKGNYTSMMDIMILGATEVDVNFNGNVVTHSDGKLFHGIGGWQNCLHAKCVILPIPLFRDRIPTIVDKVTTLVGPGSLIDVVVTERGIAINPLRKDLLEAVKNSDLPILTIEELKAEAEEIIGGSPTKPELTDEVVGVVKWVDGTVIDSIYKIKN